MARLRQHVGTGDWLVPGRCILGRSRACTIRLSEPEVSGEHASLRWTGGVWEVQDLHSRNGTYVGRRRLGPGERIVVAAGATLGFGRVDGYVLADAAAPEPFAAPLAGGPALEAHGGILALPDASDPEVTIYRGGATGWSADRAGEVQDIEDGAVVHAAGSSWRVWLPEALALTWELGATDPTIDSIGLRFSVSRDEEYVELVAQHAGRTIDLKARAHHYPLLLLARARLRDQALPDETQGWVHQDDLLGMLRMDVNRLHIDIYRIRRQLGEAGISDAARIVQRRPGTRQLRIGVARLEIRTIERAL